MFIATYIRYITITPLMLSFTILRPLADDMPPRHYLARHTDIYVTYRLLLIRAITLITPAITPVVRKYAFAIHATYATLLILSRLPLSYAGIRYVTMILLIR